jgi:hypothetical protein
MLPIVEDLVMKSTFTYDIECSKTMCIERVEFKNHKYHMTIKFMKSEENISFSFQVLNPYKTYRKTLSKIDSASLYGRWMYVRDIIKTGNLFENNPSLLKTFLDVDGTVEV